uniref:PROTEIN/DNA Complex catalytic motif, Helix-turn-helix DNA n=1 Tax=Siphoviridae sp. ct2u94 TaxID=2826277 RepID=A0A8S5QVH1_9CAUD|nr:MAG TPA: PROTEIN/DNA Complex catalytic motif, Helix-turn-helix DNA [Siphoviridae sp. ct2u94]
MAKSSDNNTFLGKKFGVNSSTILAIKRRKTWRHIGKAE